VTVTGVFLSTFVIGLREGLEATLIVGIVGAFLKRNGRSLRPMALGVGLAVAISVGVGVGLDLLSASLPQREQEMLETVIGAVAVVFVTTMIIWMNRHAARMKGELEREARRAMSSGSSLALAAMAFLAVLKEGFETAVFLLAAVQASQGGGAVGLGGAVLGILGSVGIGAAIYVGGVRVNLARFFRVSGVFLVLIAAGLVSGALRTAHEAGWVVIGQQRVLDLSSFMPTGSVTGAVVTGMFGIPPDPRLVEVLGWLCYAVPVLVVFLWPARWSPAPAARRRLLGWGAAGLAVAAVALVVLVPAGGADVPGPTRTATVASGGDVTVTLGPVTGATRDLTVASGAGTATVPLAAAGQQTVGGVVLSVWQAKVPADPGRAGNQVTLGELAALAGGRLPVGLNAGRTPGPFTARWAANVEYDVLAAGGSLISANAASTRVATLQGGGLPGSKTVSVGSLGTDWSTPEQDTAAGAAALADAATDRAEQMLWRAWLPTVLAVAAVACLAVAITRGPPTPEPTPVKRKEKTAA
jgi:high-affinity iron transporter